MQVEEEVTDRIEKAVNEMTQVLDTYSVSSPGMSTVVVFVKEDYWADRLPQVWDELRKKVTDKGVELPPGTGAPRCRQWWTSTAKTSRWSWARTKTCTTP